MPEKEQLLRPVHPGPGICTRCFNLTNGFGLCYACELVEPWLSSMTSISYSVSGSPLHRALWGYKRLRGPEAERARLELAILLAHFLSRHQSCLALTVSQPRFDIVTTVPSSDACRDEHHPLRNIVERMIPSTARDHERLLRTRPVAFRPHSFDHNRFSAIRPLSGETVLLLDDTWTTGASAQSAAAALRRAGSGKVAALVIGRHLNREWLRYKGRMEDLESRFAWSRCSACR